MNRIFKTSSLVVVALLVMYGCTDELYLSPESVVSGSRSVPFGTIHFQTGAESRGDTVTTENLSAVEATAYTDIEKNEFKFETALFHKKDDNGNFVSDKNPQWPGIHRYRKPDADTGEYPDGTTESQKIPENYSEWRDKPFNNEADARYEQAQKHLVDSVNNAMPEGDVPTGYVYLEDYNDRDYIYIIDYDEPSTLNVFVYSPPLKELRDAFLSGTQGKPGSQGLLLTPCIEVYDFFNTYIDGVGLTPPENYNERTELKIYYEDTVPKPGYKLGMFHVAQDISRQVDFVTAHVQKPRRIIQDGNTGNNITPTDENENEIISHTYTLEPVPVELKHNLCNIEVKARNDNSDYDIDVAGVMLGRPMVYGPMFNFSTNEWEFPPLTRQDLYNEVSYAYSPASDKHPVGDSIHRLGKDPVSLMGNGGNALVLPPKLDAWNYLDPDNPDAYNFNNGDRPIMFLAALIQVLPKNVKTESYSIDKFMYPFGYPTDNSCGEDSEWIYCPDKEGGVWEYNGEEWEYYGGGGWYDYTEEFNGGDGWEYDPETGYWTYNNSEDRDWEMLTDENDNAYWKYNGKFKFKYDGNAGGEWILGDDIIFPTDYVCKNSNFEYQEFCVDKNGDVLALSYNDRDKSEFTDDEKKELKSKYKDKDITFKKYAWVGFPVAVDWKAGHKYTYVLDFTSGLGVEIPNGIYGGRYISDIIKLFKDYEATGKPVHDINTSSANPRRKMKTSNLPSGIGTVTLESSGKWTGGVIVK